jgi:hypothetical protein
MDASPGVAGTEYHEIKIEIEAGQVVGFQVAKDWLPVLIYQ